MKNIFLFFLSACNQFDKNEKSIVYLSDQKYSNTGFTLIYNEQLKKEYDNKQKIFKIHKIKITNFF